MAMTERSYVASGTERERLVQVLPQTDDYHSRAACESTTQFSVTDSAPRMSKTQGGTVYICTLVEKIGKGVFHFLHQKERYVYENH